MSSSDESAVGRWPRTMSSPEVASSRPVITLSRVVFPLPLGPTNMVSSPKRISRSMPRSAWTFVSPRPKVFVTSLETTAIPFEDMGLPPENHCGFEHEYTADAHQAGQNDHKEDHHGDAGHDLPGQNNPARRQIVQKYGEEGRGHAHAQGVPGAAYNHRLEQNHPDNPPVGHTDGLQGAKVFQVLDGEDVEGLSGHHTADNERDHHRNAEVHGNACIPQIKKERIPGKLPGSSCAQSCSSLNAMAYIFNGNTRSGLGENKREEIALTSHKPQRLAVARVQHREALKRCGRVADPHNQDAPLVHLQGLAHLKRLPGEEIKESCLINDARVRLVEVADRSQQHLSRSTHKSRIAHTHENHGAEFSVRAFRTAGTFVERDSPLDTGNAADAIKVRVAQGVHFTVIE